MDEAITYFQSSKSSNTNDNSTNPEMQLKNYMQTQLNSGYNIELIKSSLIGAGYDAGMVNKVANDLRNMNINVKHEVSVSKGTIIGIVAVIFIVGLVVYGIFNFSIFKPDEALMDVTVSTNTYAYAPGENINYQLHITNMGSLQRFDAIIKCVIVDDLGNVITRKEETLAVQTTASVNRNIQLPQNTKPGRYNLQIIADYGKNMMAKSSAEFEVIQKSVIIPSTDIPSSGGSQTENNDNINTGQTGGQGTSNTGTTGTSSNVEIDKTFGNLLTEVRQTAKNNPELASSTCTKISSIEQRDVCYSVMADSSRMYSYCDKISDDIKKDNCYLSFVMKGNVDICHKILDDTSKSFCEQLHIIQLMDKYYRENNTEKIMELSKQFNPEIIKIDPQVQTYEYTYTETAKISISDVMSNADAPIANQPAVNTSTNST
ncbi:MAG: hypothetical protein ACP5NW_00495 [Candidatus Woesearchaeota archaeon]